MDSYSLYYFVTRIPIPGVLLEKLLKLFRSIYLEARRGIQITHKTQTVYNHQTMNGVGIELETKKQALRPFHLWAGRHWGSHSTWLAPLNLMSLNSRWGKQCFLFHTHRTERAKSTCSQKWTIDILLLLLLFGFYSLSKQILWIQNEVGMLEPAEKSR